MPEVSTRAAWNSSRNRIPCSATYSRWPVTMSAAPSDPATSSSKGARLARSTTARRDDSSRTAGSVKYGARISSRSRLYPKDAHFSLNSLLATS